MWWYFSDFFNFLNFRIYLNEKFFGKIDASPKMDRQGYQYVITGLNPEESYDVKVKVRMKIHLGHELNLPNEID